jgi:low temperature requirement protein LtrA
MVALAVDYGGPALIGIGRGWRIAPAHFAERYGLVMIIALGESLIAIGVGAGFELSTGELAAAALGIVVIGALWWLYFDVAAIIARRRLAEATAVERARLARDAYDYAHLPMIAGIVLFAFGLETTLHAVDEALNTVPAVGLCAGAALYLLGLVGFLLRATGYLFRRRTLAAAILLALIPATIALPALAALALVSTVCALVVAYEAMRYRGPRLELRHPELAP